MSQKAKTEIDIFSPFAKLDFIIITEGLVAFCFNGVFVVSIFLYYIVHDEKMWNICDENVHNGNIKVNQFRSFIVAKKILVFVFNGVVLAMANSLRFIRAVPEATEYVFMFHFIAIFIYYVCLFCHRLYDVCLKITYTVFY